MSSTATELLDDPGSLGEVLDRIRRARGMTWNQLGEVAGLSTSGLRKIRKGDANPNPATLRAIERALDLPHGHLHDVVVSVDGLLEPSPGPWNLDPPAVPPTSFHATTVTGVLVHIPVNDLTTMTEQQQRDFNRQLGQYAAFLVQQIRGQ